MKHLSADEEEWARRNRASSGGQTSRFHAKIRRMAALMPTYVISSPACNANAKYVCLYLVRLFLQVENCKKTKMFEMAAQVAVTSSPVGHVLAKTVNVLIPYKASP